MQRVKIYFSLKRSLDATAGPPPPPMQNKHRDLPRAITPSSCSGLNLDHVFYAIMSLYPPIQPRKDYFRKMFIKNTAHIIIIAAVRYAKYS